MCRSIKQLRIAERPATEQEIQEAALQFVRKISGFRKPSRANQAVFDAAVVEVSAAAERLLRQLAPPAGERAGSVRGSALPEASGEPRLAG
jgi:hypothetical protein